MAVIGLDLGGTKLAAAIFDTEGTILFQTTVPLEKRRGKQVGSLITSTLSELLSYSEKNLHNITAIGICIPGISWSKTGKVWAPNIPEWDDYPLKEEITSSLNGKNIQVKIDSDRSCYILGEVWKGSASGCSDAIFLAVGTGIGAGILVNGQILRGSNNIAGAIGWLALDKPFLEKYTSCGCFEYHASGEGLARVAREIIKDKPDYQGALKIRNPEEITARDVFEQYKNGDEAATDVITQAIEFWGMTTANLVSLFNPEKIIFGGGVFGPAVQFLDQIMNEARKWAQPISINQVQLEASALGSDAGLYGAGYLALKH